MRIAVNTRFLLTSKMEGFGWYTFEILKRIVQSHPEHEFIFFFDRPYDHKFIFADNVEPVVLSPQARHPLLHYIWFEYSIKKALKKYHADIFFSPDGYLCLKTAVPQIAVIHDINFEHNPQDLPWLVAKYLQHFFPKFAQKAQKIITVSEFSKKDIAETYHIESNKISAIWNGASEMFKPVDDLTQIKIRDKYTEGKPYFLFVGALHPRKNIKRLIQAFVQFKNEKYNEINLLIVGTALWSSASKDFEIPEEYSNQIKFIGHVELEELANIMGSAFALTYVPYFEGFGIPLVEAMKCGTPIIAGNMTSLPEVAGEAALYCNPFNVDNIKEKMIELTGSPEYQTKLSSLGLERSKLFSWENSANLVWQEICSIKKK